MTDDHARRYPMKINVTGDVQADTYVEPHTARTLEEL